MDPLIFSITFTILCAVVFLAAAVIDRRIAFAFAAIAALYLGLDDLVTGIGSAVDLLSIPGTHWNWSGKVLSLVLSVSVIAALGLSRDAVGLTAGINWKVGIIALLLFLVWGACLGYLFKPGAADAETIVFQATMPGIAEELVYRGILPAILLGLIRHKAVETEIPWIVILATSLAFGIWHGLGYSKASFSFDTLSALFPFIGSIPGGWLRFKTRSLLVPILAHSIANVAFCVMGIVLT